MSLFKAQEFWSVNLNVPDAFDGQCLLIETVNGRSCIFLSSHDGYLRAFCPADGDPIGYKPSDLLYETLFPVPVLQMAMGRFVSGSPNRQLAVLHPKLLSIYAVQRTEDNDEHVLALRHVYQHVLPRTAYGFVAGCFGNVQGREFICVQSLDGQLSFFEQETATFHVQLPDYLLPLPFRYIPPLDAFLFQDCQNYLKCFTFEELSLKKPQLKPIWLHNLGDLILDMTVLIIGTEVHVIVLTERNIFDLNQHGKIEWMKLLEYQPVCFHSFVNKFSGDLITLICTDDQTVNVYERTCLKWSVKIDFPPVCVNVLNMTANLGLMVLLSDCGLVQCVYLGTVPALYLIPPTAEPEINITEAEQELKNLELRITDTELETEDIVKLTLKIDPKVSIDDGRNCSGVIELSALTPINNVQVLIHVEPPFVASHPSFMVASIVSTEQIAFKVSVQDGVVASLLAVKVLASYFLSNGAARVTEAVSQLPFELAAESAIPTKDAPVKLTLTSNKPACLMNELFPEFSDATAGAVGFVTTPGSVVTIVAAKTSQRYRIQGNTFEDLTLVLFTLVERVQHFYRKTKEFSLSFSGPLPIAAYFEVIEGYYELVTRRRLLQDQLAQRSTQYRTIQKKVLASLNDLTPKPTLPLYQVLADTYSMIRTVINDLEKLETELNVHRSRLASLSRLIITLLGLMSVNQTDLQYLRQAFHPIVHDGEEQVESFAKGWLETQNATLSLLLRTAFAKSSKDQNKPVDMTLDPLSDVSKLCKLFSTLVDRATKGTSLVERAEFENESLPTLPSVKEWHQQDLNRLPKATKFTDLNQFVEKVPKVVERVVEESPVVHGQTEAVIEPQKLREDSPKTPPKEVIIAENNEDIWDLNIDELKI